MMSLSKKISARWTDDFDGEKLELRLEFSEKFFKNNSCEDLFRNKFSIWYFDNVSIIFSEIKILEEIPGNPRNSGKLKF